MTIKQEPAFLCLNSEFPKNIMDLVKEHKIKMVYWDLGGTLVDLSLAMKEKAVKEINTTYRKEISIEMFDQKIRAEWKRRETPQAIRKIKLVDNDRKERQYWIEFYTCVLENHLEICVKDRRVVKWLATVQSNPKSFEELPFVRATLARLKEMNIPVGIISNAFPSARRILDKNGLIQEFDEQHVILSYEYNSVKPERAIYQEAINQAKVKPQEILFIDDRKSFVEGAVRKGMKAVVVNDSEGQDFSGSGKSKVTKNEYSADQILIADKSCLNPYFAELGVLLFQFVIGFLCNQNNQRVQYTGSLSLRRGM
jgi:HAD superfamily hydrolase (TIGR01509 family)